MDKRIVVVMCIAIAGSTAAITHNLSKTDYHCATDSNEVKYEDDYCAAYWHHGHIIIGPLSDVVTKDGDVIVGSHE